MTDDLIVELVRIDAIHADPNNARKHNTRNLEAIAGSLAAFGQRRPLVVMPDGTVIAGNGTLAAAVSLEWSQISVTRVPPDWTPERAKAYALADNRTAELATWDEAILGEQLVDLVEFFDLGALGFDYPAVDAEIIEDEPPEPPAEAVTKPGDLWLLGQHRVLCGDSTRPEDLARLMSGRTAEVMFTDPPWNVAIGQDSNPKHRQRAGLANDNLSAADFAAFLDGFVKSCGPHVSGDVYCVLGASEWPTLDLALRKGGLHWSATIIWVKDTFVLGRSKYHRRYEPIWYGWRDKSSFCDLRTLDDVWEIPRPKRSEEHPTMKPVVLVGRAIANSSKRGSVILDPFLGSGTTLIAAEQLGRDCYGLELDPLYVDVIVARWEAMSGHKAVLET